MKKYLLPPVPKYFKANLHCHTNISDGKFTPEEVKHAYQKEGYQIVAFTDHEICVPHPELTDDDFIAITSYELQILDPVPLPCEFAKCYHLNFYAKDPANRWQVFHPIHAWGNLKNYADQVVCDGYEDYQYNLDYVNQVIQRANDHGFLACLNHPYWSLQDWADYAGVRGLWGIEVYNTSSDFDGYEDHNTSPYRDMLLQGQHLVPVAADDNHATRDCFGGWMMIGAEKLTYDAVMAAMERKDLYASTGPEIRSLTLDGTTLQLSCSEAVQVQINTNSRVHYFRSGEGLTELSFDLQKWFDCPEALQEQTFFRITITDAQGRKAYTRAYWRSELI